ncbi:hypothetical protein [Nioella sp.]|uniref:hypothetical protein n=1 Tax=Nioella sp. TaxID=1912091 RepID=UPI003A85BE65
MVEIADIRDEESLKAWLEDKPRELAVLLAHRAAARVMPIYWSWVADPSNEGELTDIIAWRILPTTRAFAMFAILDVATTVDTSELRPQYPVSRAITAAAIAALAATTIANATIAATAVATAAAVVPAPDFWDEVRRDATNYLDTNIRAPLSLWHNGIPPEITGAWEAAALSRLIEAGDTGWQFWIEWYEAQLSGADQNWEMLKEIVLIPDEDWKQGAAHVNSLIAETVTNATNGPI